MSLQVWLPLNGNDKNIGVNNGDITTTVNPVFVSSDKMGRALSTGSFSMSASMTSSILNNKEFSISFWIYPNADTGDANKRGMIFGNDQVNQVNGSNNRKFSVFQYPTCNDLHLSWMNDSPTAMSLSTVISGVFPSYTWTHCVVTYNNPNCKVYINGKYYSSFTATSNSSSFEYTTRLMQSCSYRYLNDYRIYNNCLTAKEVDVLSRGLVLHHTLSNLYSSNGDLFNQSSGLANYNSGVITRNGSYNEYKIVSAVTTSTWGSGFNLSRNKFSVPYGQSYRATMKVWVPTEHVLVIDYNNNPSSGALWNGNDNDNTSTRLSNVLTIPAATWTTVTWGTTNTHASNTNKLDINPYDGLGLITSADTAPVTWYIRDLHINIGTVVANYDIANENLLRNASKYIESSPYVVTGTTNDNYLSTDMYCPIDKAGGSYVLQSELEGTWSKHLNSNINTATIWLYLRTNYDPTKTDWDTPVCYSIKNMSTTNGVWYINIPAGYSMARIRLNTYSDGTKVSTVKFWNIKLEKGSSVTPFSFNHEDDAFKNTKLDSPKSYDTSGYNYNGTITNGISSDNNSPRYNGCCKFNGTNYIHINTNLGSVSQFTISGWIKPNASNEYFATFLSNNTGLGGGGLWLASNTENSGLWSYRDAYGKSNKGLLTNDTWYHFIYIFNKGVITWYQNGVNAGSSDMSSKGTTQDLSNIYIGNAYTGTSWNTKFYGCLSDIRLYTTILDESAIKELYNAPISITNKGTLMLQGEIIEK